MYQRDGTKETGFIDKVKGMLTTDLSRMAYPIGIRGAYELILRGGYEVSDIFNPDYHRILSGRNFRLKVLTILH